MTALLTVENVEKRFGGGRGLFGRKPAVHAVQGVDVVVETGETLGIVGESGCGKSTLARMLVGLDRPTSGSITMAGIDPSAFAHGDTRTLARTIQYVFQDPVSSLNPRKTIRTILETPMIHLLGLDAARRAERLAELMEAVKLSPDFLDRYPHEFSGGQAQRIGIARALAAEPKLVILDEPVSALDVSVQAQVLNLLEDLQQRFGLTYVFISHDLSVVRYIADEVMVMYFGEAVEYGTRDEVFSNPQHSYTKTLFAATPRADVASIRARLARKQAA